MTAGEPHDLRAFGRASGYDPAPCPDCSRASSEPCRSRCTNCGGSGRLWTSPRGSLSDEGLARLRHLVGG